MRIPDHKSLAILAILGSLIAAPEVLRAADGAAPGVIRISDRITPTPEPNPLPVSSSGVVSSSTGIYYAGYSGGDCNECNGNCGRRGCGCCGFLSAMFCPWGGCTHSPGHGWSPPQKYPLNRVPIVYQRYYPRHWYGQPGYGMPAKAPRAPVVYMPTDTTQLGYYYKRVPQWQPNPGMLPPAPRPSQYHNRASRSGFNNYGGHVISSGTIITPVPNSTPSNGQPSDVVPPKPTSPSKSAAAPNRAIR